MNDETPVIPIRNFKDDDMKKEEKENQETFKQATFAALGCMSWIGVVAALIGLFALVQGVFF